MNIKKFVLLLIYIINLQFYFTIPIIIKKNYTRTYEQIIDSK
uniref:Uncharacterized protein n=1 Tax=viral metagenome TaxID=1070528 RepID=A0A6C0LEN6_9ZZZZ